MYYVCLLFTIVSRLLYSSWRIIKKDHAGKNGGGMELDNIARFDLSYILSGISIKSTYSYEIWYFDLSFWFNVCHIQQSTSWFTFQTMFSILLTVSTHSPLLTLFRFPGKTMSTENRIKGIILWIQIPNRRSGKSG